MHLTGCTSAEPAHNAAQLSLISFTTGHGISLLCSFLGERVEAAVFKYSTSLVLAA